MEGGSKNLLIIAIGSSLIGGMIHFLIFPILYSIGTRIWIKKLLIIYSTMTISELYVLLPELFLNIFGGQTYYQGIDPIEQSEQIQASLSLLERITGTFDPIVQGNWSETIWLSMLIPSFLGLIMLTRKKLVHRGFAIPVLFFSLLNFSGLLWQISLNRVWTNIPVVGGMFRNPDKIYIFVLVAIIIFASYYLSHNRATRYTSVILILFSTLNFYSNNNIEALSQVAELKTPVSYANLDEQLSKNDNSIRTLLLPIPKWFHFYDWSGDIQMQNILRRTLSAAVISDEMETLDNIDTKFHSVLKSVYGTNCVAAKIAAAELGITHIVLQRDILNSVDDLVLLERNLLTCFQAPYFRSNELLVLRTGVKAGIAEIYSELDSHSEKSQVQKSLFGYRICLKDSQDYSFLLKEKVSKHSYLLFNKNMKRFPSVQTAEGWRKWKLRGEGCYQVINSNSIISTLSLFVSASTVIILTLMQFSKLKLLLKKRLRSPFENESSSN
jgi:hypothetical protein